MVPYLLVFAYLVILVRMAYSDSVKILGGKPVNHSLNAAIHIAGAIGLYFIGNLQIAVGSLFLGRVAFDLSLNKLRNLPIFYTPDDPASLVDKIENKIFKKNKLVATITEIVGGLILLFI